MTSAAIQQVLSSLKAGGSAVGTLYSAALNGDGGGWNGYTMVVRFPASVLTLPSGSITQMRVTIEAGSVEGVTITNAYIGHRAGSGDVYDFATTPVQLLWGGSGTKAIAAGVQEVSDWAIFAYDKTTDLLISAYTNGGASVDTYRRLVTATGVFTYERAATNEAGTVNKTTGYTATSNHNLGIAKIETDGY